MLANQVQNKVFTLLLHYSILGVVEFEWDETKDDSNFKKHGIRFSEAASIWLDEVAIEIHDPEHGHDEERLGPNRNVEDRPCAGRGFR